jgi:hypothetical protein
MTRPDIRQAVVDCARNNLAVGEEQILAVKRIFKYIKGTKELGITFRKSKDSGGPVLVGYVDADFAGDEATSLSTTGWVFKMSGGPVSWHSKLQKDVALSTAEAEYIAACSAVQEAVYLRQILECTGFPQQGPTILYEDNVACIAMSKNPVIGKLTRHIRRKYHFVRQKAQLGEIELVHIDTKEQIADILTKPLNREIFERLRPGLTGPGT